MSTTLTNGLKLPDKGSVDWYADMQSNYAILDGAVGTVAEHTSQIAGKAPAVHTHTKSDITDLFNSANTWTEENTFTANNINFKRSFTLGDSSYNICRLQYQDASLTRWGTFNFIHNTDNSVNCDIGVVAKKENDTVNVNASIRLTIKPDNSAELIPLNNNKINLGSSSYQWNNLYAKNYFYNGTAWGLDKYNIWTNSQAYKLTGTEVGSTTSGYISLSFVDKNNAWLGFQRVSVYSDGRTCMSWKIYNTDSNSQSISSSLEYYITKTEVKVFAPVENGEVNLGASTNKWKSLNGINPGALSLPSADDESFNGDLTNKAGTTSNKKTWSINGWGYIRIANVAGDFISVVATSAHETYLTTGTGSGNDNIGVAFPIVSGREYAIYVKTSGSVVAYYMPTLGNVA